MIFAIKSPSGFVHSVGKSVDEIKAHIRVNPLATMVRKQKGKWVAVISKFSN